MLLLLGRASAAAAEAAAGAAAGAAGAAGRARHLLLSTTETWKNRSFDVGMDDEGFCPGKKEDVALPKATMAKIIKEMLPRDVRVGKNTQDLLGDVCQEFITLLSTEANEVCSKEDKKTIAPEHILEALRNLGFTSYLPEVQEAYEQYKMETLESPRPGGRGSLKENKNTGMTDEEAIAEQQRMFAAARAAMQMKSGSGLASPPGSSPGANG